MTSRNELFLSFLRYQESRIYIDTLSAILQGPLNCELIEEAHVEEALLRELNVFFCKLISASCG